MMALVVWEYGSKFNTSTAEPMVMTFFFSRLAEAVPDGLADGPEQADSSGAATIDPPSNALRLSNRRRDSSVFMDLLFRCRVD
jgi:hypothetical protein